MAPKHPKPNQPLHFDAHRPRKRFGQNFLHDPFVIQLILTAINVQSTDHLVEIGPGLGAITEGLVEDCQRLDVVELDRDLIPRLTMRFAHLPHFNIHNSDALRFDFSSLYKVEEPLRIVGNLPYNISTPLIFHLLSYANIIQDMHFMLQKEVVNRLCAQVGDSAYGRLGIMVQYHCTCEKILNVGPGAFNPPPKVDSAVVKLSPHKTKPVITNNPELLSKLVAAAFNQRRKTIRNGLKNLATVKQLEKAGIDPTIRAEKTSLALFARLADIVDETT